MVGTDLLARVERHGRAEALHSAERAVDHALLLPRHTHVGPEVAGGLRVTQHLREESQQAVRDSHHRLGCPEAPGQAMGRG
jgi:hypothetical protein